MATHSSILAWEIPWTEEPFNEGPQSIDSQRVRHTEQLSMQTVGPGKEDTFNVRLHGTEHTLEVSGKQMNPVFSSSTREFDWKSYWDHFLSFNRGNPED